LRRFENQHFFKTAQDDAVLEEFATEGECNVIATDTVLAHLMTCTRSVFPWDIVATYANGTVVLDVRDPLVFELHSVSETASALPTETDQRDINGRAMLSIEATTINEHFSQQVLAVNNGKVPEPPTAKEVRPVENPLWDPVAAAAEAAAEAPEGSDPSEHAKKPASIAFRYRQWTLGKDISLIARTSIHAVLRKKGSAASNSTSQYLQVYSLNEWDSKVAGIPEWKGLIDMQRGNVLSTEIKNNAFKLAKFTASALLSGADSMRLGFVSRVSRADPESHSIVGTQVTAPTLFATQLQLDQKNMWAIVKWLVDMVRKHAKNLQESTPDEEYLAKFVLARDPAGPLVHFYNVPVDAFDREQEKNEEEEEEEHWEEDADQ
jgi:translation initiation factor 3 subunit D